MGSKCKSSEAAEQGTVKRNEHLEKMSKERLTEKMCVNIGDTSTRRRPKMTWKDGVKDALSYQGLNM